MISVIYSSKTGNTKMVAAAIAETIGVKAESITETDLSCSDIILGFWVDKSTVGPEMMGFLPKLHNKRIILFATLGAPIKEYADKCIMNAAKLIPEDNEILPLSFFCQGKIDPELIKMFEKLPPDNPHALTPENRARFEAASKHPDEKDLLNAADFAKKAAKLFE